MQAFKQVSIREPDDREFVEIAEFSFQNYVSETSRASGVEISTLLDKLGGPPRKKVGDLWLVVELNSRRAGYLWLELNSEDSSAFGWDIYLEPEFRSQGIGRRVMRLCGERLLRAGIRRVEICVYEHNWVARRLYESLGFRVESSDEEKKRFRMGLSVADNVNTN